MTNDKLSKKQKKDKQPSLIIDAFNFKNISVKADFYSSYKNFNWKLSIKNLFLILLGAFLTATSFYYFINPANLYTNGLSAFAQLIAKIIAQNIKDVPVERSEVLYFYPIYFAINIPIIIWGILKVGFRFTIYSTIYIIFQIAISNLLLFTPVIKDFKFFDLTAPASTDNILARTFIFAAIGGLIYGAGIGVLFKTGGSSGGMDFISTYISMKRKYSIANVIKNTNIIIVIIAVFLGGRFVDKKPFFEVYFGETYFLGTIVYIYIAAFIMNRVYPKYMLMTVIVISSEVEKIRSDIYRNNYLRGGNIWNVKGLYSGNEYKMMMTTMSLLEYNFFKYKIMEIDPKVFMVALPAKYMVGGSPSKSTPKKPINIAKITE